MGLIQFGGLTRFPVQSERKDGMHGCSVVSDSFSYRPKRGHDRSYGNSILIFLRNHHTIFHDSCTLYISINGQFSSVQSLSHVRLFVIPWTAACQASLSITNTCSLLKLMSIESVMPSNQLILCCPLLLPPSIFPSIRVFSNESVLHIRWPKYWRSWGFCFSCGIGLKLNIQKMKIMTSSPITSWQIEGEKVETMTNFLFLGFKITADGDCRWWLQPWN